MNQQKAVPVSILTGFLGAGKTTLLNNILNGHHGYKFAVIINEIGKIGIDGHLVERQQEEIVEMSNGCLCCTIRKDLIQGVQNILKKGNFDYLLIETTGIAEPGPIAQTFLNIPQMHTLVRLDSIITVVDAEQILKQMASTDTARDQIAMADFILLNKTDLVEEFHIEAVEAKLRSLNTYATIIRTRQSKVTLTELLDVHAFDVEQKLGINPAFLDELKNRHHHDINAVSVEFHRAFDVYALEKFITELSEQERIYRSKGFLWVEGNPRRAVFHGVNNRFTMIWDRPWENDEIKRSQLVFIGKGIEEMKIRRQLQNCLVAQR